MSWNNCCPPQQCCTPKPCCRTITYRCTKPPPPPEAAPPVDTGPVGGGANTGGGGNNTGGGGNNTGGGGNRGGGNRGGGNRGGGNRTGATTIAPSSYTFPFESTGSGRPPGGGVIVPPNQKCEEDDWGSGGTIEDRAWPINSHDSSGGGGYKRKWPILPWSGPLPKPKWDDPWRGHCECEEEDTGGTTRPVPPPVAGCTDPAATNYNPLATVDDGSCVYPPPPLPGACNDLGQLTPTYRAGNEGGAADINLATQISQAVSSVVSQDPDGILWIAPSAWAAAEWDGIPFDTSGWPTSPTTAQLYAYLFPTPNTMRGLRQHFYTINPFVDNTAPTVAEIDQWNVEVVRCLRKVLGITTPVGGSRCLFLRCQWALERKWSTVWNTLYPSDVCYPIPPGPTGQPHCGDAFHPTCAEQIPYYADPSDACCPLNAGAVGLSTVNTDIPWSIKLSRVIGTYVASEGMTGHPGPFFTRECCGFSFMIFDGPLGGGGTSEYRGKWSN